MPFNVPEEKKPEFNKQVKKGLELLAGELNKTALQIAESEPAPIDFSSIPEELAQGVIQEAAITPPVVEFDAIRDKDGNIISNPLDLLSTPLNENKSKALGLIDAEGNPTDRGELFFNMKEAGMLDDTGVITEKGKAYLLPKEDLKLEENRPAFKILWDDGVIRDQATKEGMLDAVLKFSGEALSGVGNIISLTAQNLYYQFDNRKGFGIPFIRDDETRPQELIDKTVAMNLAVVEGFTKNTLELAKMADVGTAWIVSELKDPANWGEVAPAVKESEDKLVAAQQRQWSARQTMADMAVGETAQVIWGSEEAVAVADEARNRVGKEVFDETYRNISATTEIVGGVENLVPISFAVKASRLVPLATRAEIGAQKTIAKVLAQDLEIATKQASIASAEIAVEKGTTATALAERIVQKGATAGADAASIARAERAAEIARRTATATQEAATAIPKLQSELDVLLATRNKLSSKIPEAAANATLKTLETGRALRGMPAKAVGTVMEKFGSTLTKVDDSITNFLKDRGIDQMYSAALGAAGVAGVAGSPVVGAIAAGAGALKAGKVITNYGKLFKYVGKEMTKVRGQIPFWKRVAAHTEPGSLNRGIAHTFNMLDLGGVTSDTLRRIPRGVAAAYPVDLMFEYLSDGADMRPETFYQAAAESLVIGGAFSAAGGAFMGTKSRMRELANGDWVNFTQEITDPEQKVLYNELSSANQKAIATYAIANPTLNYVFKSSGASNYDPNTNTATINVRSNNSIKALVAHETLHHTLIKNNMEGGISALFLGDTINNTVGGLLRSRDGKLDPNFEAFKNAYYQRLNLDGMTDAEKNAIYPLDKIAVEYFIEQHADQYAGMAESGELGGIAASGEIKRKLSGVLETVLPRIPVLRDLHFKSGGMIDKDGSWVTGNGILDAGGVKTNPITNKMFRDMNRRSAGLVPGQFEPLVSDTKDAGAQITLDPTNPIDSELLHPIVKVDENGVPILENGKPVALDKATLLERALAGLTAKEVMRRKRAENYIPEKGEAHIDDIGEFQPGWLSNDVLAEMFAKNKFNPEQKRIIREMNRMIKEGKGNRAVMINFPATTKNKAGKAVYKSQGATLRDTVPVAITISKDGNLLFGLMSVTKLQENIQKRSQSRRGKKLYGGNVDLILRDTQAMMQFHKDGVDSIEYFKQKYGAVEATERKNFINTMFGLLNQKEQAVLNPMLIEDGVKSRDNVYRTYRADRVSKAVSMSPDDYPAMPFIYEAVSQVKMPEQARQMPEVAVVPERFTGSAADTDRRGKYVEPPGFFKKFNIDSYERGGRFFDAANGEDLTGKKYSTGSIDVSTGKPRLFVDNVSDVAPSGNKFKTNLFKQKAGWKWTSENPPPTSTIVSVEGQGKHIYTLKANFESGVELARYSEKVSEPRLRPTAYGELKLGEKVGEISIRGKSHPVYDSVGIIPKRENQARQMPEEPITPSSEKWKSMSNEEKDAYVFTPAEMTPSNKAEFEARVQSGSLPADTPVVDINRSSLLTSRYGPPSSSATGDINIWIDDNTGKPVAVAFAKYGNIPTKGGKRLSAESKDTRYMPEQARQMEDGQYNRETAIKNKQIISDRFENFRPQVGVQGLTYGWQRPSDGKFIKIDQHHFLYRDDNGNQLGDPLSIGYVRIAKEGNTLFYDGKPNTKQLKELKDTAIENNLDLQNSTPRYMPEKVEQPSKQWNPNPIIATNKIARSKGIPERITDDLFELIKNKPVVVGMADLLGAGGKIRGVDVSGGPGYPIQNFDPANPDAITGVWASERTGINTILQNMVKTDSIWQDESGHNWALFAPHTMSQSAHKSNAQTPEIYLSKINDMAISGALKKITAIDLSDHIRTNVPMAKDMPNIGTEKLTKFIHDAAFETRAAIMSELSNIRSRDLGAPSPETILTESRDPQYHGVEKNAITGILLVDVDRLATKDDNGNWKLRNDLSADDFNIPKHPSYGTVMPGRVLVHFDNPVPFRISTPVMIDTMRTASPLSRIDYLLARMPKDKGIKFQPLTDQIKNAINEAQNISGNVPFIREAVKAVNGNWKKFTSGASLKGLNELIGAIHRSPARDSLTQYNLSDLQKMIKEDKMEVHQLGDNDIWFGVKKSKDGNELVSVVNNTGIPGMLNLIMQRALEVGVNKLDAYAVPTLKTPNGLLPSLYERYGWKEVERMPFDRQYLVERVKGEKKSDHEAKITQKEAALKMFWTEQGWDGQSNPDVVFMTYEKGRKPKIIVGESQGSLAGQRIAESGTTSEATSGEVRGARLAEGREPATIGGATQGNSGASEGILPRGFDSIVQSLRSASPVQIETIGITDIERKKFLSKLGIK